MEIERYVYCFRLQYIELEVLQGAEDLLVLNTTLQ